MIEVSVGFVQKVEVSSRALYGNWSSLRIKFKEAYSEDRLEILMFMPHETAEQYASAINACNDREAVDAKGSIMAKPDDME